MNDLEKLVFIPSNSNKNNNNKMKNKLLKFEDLFLYNFQNVILINENDNNNSLKLNDYNLETFNEQIINKNKENLLYYSLSSS